VRTAFVEGLELLAETDERVILVTGDLGFGVLDRFARRFPRQYVNAGVAEQNMVGLATGLALEGHVVFTYSIGNFATLRCLEQIRNDAAYHDANVNVVAVGGGFSYGPLGISHHATEDLAIMRSLPGVTVVAPGDATEARQVALAVASAKGTTYVRLDRSGAEATRPDDGLVLGRARVLREGTDLTLIGTGGILGTVMDAAEALSAEGLECRVLSMHTVKPLDDDAVLRAATETGGIITIEEHSIHGGLAGAVAEICLERRILPREFARVGLRAGFSSVVGSQSYLRSVYGMDSDAIVASALLIAKRASQGTASDSPVAG